MVSDPGHHAVKRAARLAVRVYALLLVVEIGIVNARGPCDEQVDVARYTDEGTVCGGANGCVSTLCISTRKRMLALRLGEVHKRHGTG